jgi:hypothetical protein
LLAALRKAGTNFIVLPDPELRPVAGEIPESKATPGNGRCEAAKVPSFRARERALIYASRIIKARSHFVNSTGDKSMTEFRFGPTDPC